MCSSDLPRLIVSDSSATQGHLYAPDDSGYQLDETFESTDLGGFTRRSGRFFGHSMACDGLGNVAVASRETGTLDVYDREGRHLRTFPAREPGTSRVTTRATSTPWPTTGRCSASRREDTAPPSIRTSRCPTTSGT